MRTDKKNLRRISIVVTTQTKGNLERLAAVSAGSLFLIRRPRKNIDVSVAQKNMMIWNVIFFDGYKPTLKNEMEAKEDGRKDTSV